MAFGHVKQDAKDAFFFELFVTERLTICSIAMPELSIAVECPAESIITESRLEVKITALADAYLEFVLCPSVSHDLPIMHTLSKALVSDDRSEQVLFLLQEERAVHRPHLDYIRSIVRVPGEGLDCVLLASDDEARRADFILFEHGNRLAVLIFTDMLLIKANSLLLTTATGILLLLADYVIVVVVGDATRV